jgi:hypothetical protein
MRPIIAILALLLASPAIADDATPAPTARIRGTIEQVAGDTVTILTQDGRHEAVLINQTTKIGALRALTLADVKANDFIATVAVKGSEDHLRAVEVTVLPESMRGMGEGHYPWDTGPDSSMTNATVAEVAGNADGRTLQLKYKGGEATLDVPAGIPIVAPVPGDPSLLITGKAIFAFARKGTDGKLTAGYLSVEKDGVKPPM